MKEKGNNTVIWRLLSVVLLMVVLTMGNESLAAQSYDTQEKPASFNLRFNVNVQKKIVKGLNVFVEEEIVTKNNVTEFSKFMTMAGLSYKPIPYLKIAADYTLLSIWRDADKRHDTKYWDLRHKFKFHLVGMYEYQGWQFQAREIFQTTTETEEINTYQKPQTLLELRSRLRVAYEFKSLPITPYVSCEVTNTLNAARFNEERTTVTYDHVYVNEIRSLMGVEYQPAKHHVMDFALFYDRGYNWDWDATREGAFKSVTYKISNEINLYVGYTFKF